MADDSEKLKRALIALYKVQHALACKRDNIAYVDCDYGHLTLEEVKYNVVDKAIEFITGEVQ